MRKAVILYCTVHQLRGGEYSNTRITVQQLFLVEVETPANPAVLLDKFASVTIGASVRTEMETERVSVVRVYGVKLDEGRDTVRVTGGRRRHLHDNQMCSRVTVVFIQTQTN